MERKRDYMKKHGVRKLDFINVEDNPFIGRVICGNCGSPFGRKTWNSTSEKLNKRVWQCNKRYEKKEQVRCKNKHIDEEVLYKAFVSSFNELVESKEHFIEKWKAEDELRRYRGEEFIEIMEDGEQIEEFDIGRMIEKMVVFEDKVIVGFLDGTEVECIIE